MMVRKSRRQFKEPELRIDISEVMSSIYHRDPGGGSQSQQSWSRSLRVLSRFFPRFRLALFLHQYSEPNFLNPNSGMHCIATLLSLSYCNSPQALYLPCNFSALQSPRSLAVIDPSRSRSSCTPILYILEAGLSTSVPLSSKK